MTAKNDSQFTPDDFETLGKQYPPEIDDLISETANGTPDTEPDEFAANAPDEFGRDASQRRTGHFIVPDENEIPDGGWTLPTRANGGWEHALEQPLEEQLEEIDPDEIDSQN